MHTLNDDNYAFSETVTAIKMVMVSLPNLEQIIQGNYDKIFKCKTIGELYFNIRPLIRNYVKDKTIPTEEKLQFIRFFHYPCGTIPEMIENPPFQMNQNDLGQFITNVQQKRVEIFSSPPSPEDIGYFNLAIEMTDQMDKLQIAPIEKLVDPTYFSPMSNQNPNETIQRMDVSSQVTKLFEHASSEQLEKYVEFLQSEENWNGWDLKVDLSSMSIVTLNHFLKQFSK
ncbi:Uncharacterized protein QTN25_009343 [Entamoeba marina]